MTHTSTLCQRCVNGVAPGERVICLSRDAKSCVSTDFWDDHSPEDYPEQVHPVKATFDLPDELDSAVQIDPDLMQKLHMIAQSRQISIQTLVNLWLQQQISK